MADRITQIAVFAPFIWIAYLLLRAAIDPSRLKRKPGSRWQPGYIGMAGSDGGVDSGVPDAAGGFGDGCGHGSAGGGHGGSHGGDCSGHH